MDGFFASFSKWFSEKTSSPLYFTYLGFFIAWNWRFFEIIFLESPSLFSHPRVEYIASHLIYHISNPVIDWFINICWKFLPPAFYTWVAIKYLPYIQKWALEKHLNSVFERKQMYEIKRRKFEDFLLKNETQRSEALEKIADVKEKQVAAEKRIEKAMTEEEHWDLQYLDFEKDSQSFKFKEVLETIYNKGGYIVNDYNQRNLTAGSIALADTNGLISLDGPNRINLTSKGKYFAKKYLHRFPIV